MKNFDRMKAKIAEMDIKELAEVLSGLWSCRYCTDTSYKPGICFTKGGCRKKITEWLDQEEEE